MNKKSFILYTDLYESVQFLPLEEKGHLLDAIFIFAINGKDINLKPQTKMAFSFIKRELVRNNKKWEEVRKVRKVAGKKGGLKRVENELLLRTKSSKIKQEQANQAVTVNVNDNVTDNVNVLHNKKLSKNHQPITTSKTSLTPCSEKELLEVANLLSVDLAAVKNKHQDILDLIASGEIGKYKVKTTYYTLSRWLRADIEKGYLQKKGGYKITL